MPAKRTNIVLRIENGVAFVDVSTRTFPNTVTMIDETDLPLMFDGMTGWVAAKTKKTRDCLYVVRRIGGRHAPEMQLLHRVILNLKKRSVQGDHIDGNGLDNRRKNLRPANHSQNCRNSARRRNGTSTYHGVSWDSERSKWFAKIGTGECLAKITYLGRFASEEDAARAYDHAAAALYGEFARLNFPEKINGE